MKGVLLKAIQYLVVTVFISFLMYLISPVFPDVSKIFVKRAEDVNALFKTDFNPKVLAAVLAFILFFIVYFFLTKAAGLFRKKAGVEWSDINPRVRFVSFPFSLFKTMLILCSLPLIYGYGRAFLDTGRILSFTDQRVQAFFAGFAAWSVLWLLFWKKWGFFSILEHEITHMIMGLCFFHRPKKLMVVENEGGWVQLAGVNFMITLAPYFLLTLCFLMLPLFLVIQPKFYLPYFFIMGLFTSYHTLSTVRETRFNHQPDIIFTGKIFSFFIIVLGNIFCYGFILAFVRAGFAGGRGFISQGWQNSLGAIKLLVRAVF